MARACPPERVEGSQLAWCDTLNVYFAQTALPHGTAHAEEAHEAKAAGVGAAVYLCKSTNHHRSACNQPHAPQQIRV